MCVHWLSIGSYVFDLRWVLATPLPFGGVVLSIRGHAQINISDGRNMDGCHDNIYEAAYW